MAVKAQQSRVLAGPQLVQAFLQELAIFVQRNPDREVEGTPQEIVDGVVAGTHRFGGCTEESINCLSRQLAMAVRAKGRPFHLRYEMLSGGRIKVAFA